MSAHVKEDTVGNTKQKIIFVETSRFASVYLDYFPFPGEELLWLQPYLSDDQVQ